jgi:hypothetical protein
MHASEASKQKNECMILAASPLLVTRHAGMGVMTTRELMKRGPPN